MKKLFSLLNRETTFKVVLYREFSLPRTVAIQKFKDEMDTTPTLSADGLVIVWSWYPVVLPDTYASAFLTL